MAFTFVVSSLIRPAVPFGQAGSRSAGVPASFGSIIVDTVFPAPPPPSPMNYVTLISASRTCAEKLKGGLGKAILKGIAQKLVDDLEVELRWARAAAHPFARAAVRPFTTLTGFTVPPSALVPPFYDEELVAGPGNDVHAPVAVLAGDVAPPMVVWQAGDADGIDVVPLVEVELMEHGVEVVQPMAVGPIGNGVEVVQPMAVGQVGIGIEVAQPVAVGPMGHMGVYFDVPPMEAGQAGSDLVAPPVEMGPIRFEEGAPLVEVGPKLVETDLASGIDSGVEVMGDSVCVEQVVAPVPQEEAELIHVEAQGQVQQVAPVPQEGEFWVRVSNLSFQTTEVDLLAAFSSFAPKSGHIIMEGGESAGYGYVSLPNAAARKSAVRKLNKKLVLHKRPIKVCDFPAQNANGGKKRRGRD